jgi:hypothetical protein
MPLPAEAIPTPEQVHARVASRPVFTTTSRPTLAEVGILIADKATEVDIEVFEGAVLPADLTAYARSTIAYGAAADVESTYFPEQQLGDAAPAAALTATYLRMLERLRAELADIGAGDRRAQSWTLKTPFDPIIV